MSDNQLLTPLEVVDRWRGAVTEKTLAEWRSKDTGPIYVKIGRKCLYPLEHIKEYEKEHLSD